MILLCLQAFDFALSMKRNEFANPILLRQALSLTLILGGRSQEKFTWFRGIKDVKLQNGLRRIALAFCISGIPGRI